jgi:hypothetical protein
MSFFPERHSDCLGAGEVNIAWGRVMDLFLEMASLLLLGLAVVGVMAAFVWACDRV